MPKAYSYEFVILLNAKEPKVVYRELDLRLDEFQDYDWLHWYTLL